MSDPSKSFAEKGISVVIPVYVAQGRIVKLVNEVIAFFRESGLSHEIILVDDCSPDSTWEKIKSLHAQFPLILKCYRLKYNLGQYGATIAGIDKSSGNYIITMDDDFNPAPIELSTLISVKDKVELAYGKSKAGEKNIFRRLGSGVIHVTIMIATLHFKLHMGSSFRLFHRALWNRILPELKSPEALDIELLRNVQGEVAFCQTHFNPSVTKSSHSSIQLVKLALKILVSGLSKNKLQMQKILTAEMVDEELVFPHLP